MTSSMLPSVVGKAPDARSENDALWTESTVEACRPLFDQDWYLRRNPEVARSQIDPLYHYLSVGWREGRDPHPLFSLRWYAQAYPDVNSAGINPLLHYAMFGAAEGRDPHPLFDGKWYLQRYADMIEPGANPLFDYTRAPIALGRAPNAAFDVRWYLEAYPDAARDRTILEHYLRIPAGPRRRPNAAFDFEAYRALNPDAVGSDDDLFAHYVRQGEREERSYRRPTSRHRTAVVYLARSEKGSTVGLDRFFRSYRAHPAGIDHDLIVIRKGGTRRAGARAAIDIMIGGAPVQFVDLPDVGYDIQSYLRLAGIIDHEHLCLLNTFSEILAPDWLKKLVAPLSDPGVGISGASASYESISDSVELGFKVVWLAANKLGAISPEVAQSFKTALDQNVPDWSDRIALLPDDEGISLLRRSGKIEELDVEVAYRTLWERSKLDGFLREISEYRRFPNPHVRSNGFVMRRTDLLELGFELEDTKMACVAFESGPDGLPARLARAGLRSVLVGANGQRFEVEEWSRSRTFRLDSQENLLIGDNRTREFDGFSEPEREALRRMTWGDYVDPRSDQPARLGFEFRRGNLDLLKPVDWTASARTRRAQPARRPSPEPKISIVIPSRNRLDLVKDAVSSVLRQRYRNWECVVFDNDSDNPLEDHVLSIGDPRVVYGRSDDFLPVTESWNRAIDLATGDYVILIGDDDGLLPRFCESIADTIDRFDHPDFIYSSLYQFCHPGVAPWEPSGYVDLVKAAFFFKGRSDDFLLSDQSRQVALRGSLSLRRNFMYNMQGLVFKRDFLDRLRRDGKVFHSPFPDYYIANYAIDRAIHVVVKPRPISVAGVSRKSFGFTLFNNDPETGALLLNTRLLEDPVYQGFNSHILPGSDYNTNFLITMGHVARALDTRNSWPVDVRRYRHLQIFEAIDHRDQAGRWPVRYAEHVEPLLDENERDWADAVSDLKTRSDAGDKAARRRLDGVRGRTAMYGPYDEINEVTRLHTGEFANLTQLLDQATEL